MSCSKVAVPDGAGEIGTLSGSKVKCLACGTEWVGPVVFCGECGAAITAAPDALPGDRVARVPPVPGTAAPPIVKQTIKVKPVATGETPKSPAQPVAMGETPKPPAQPGEPVRPAAAKATASSASIADTKHESRHTRPTEPEMRRTVAGMPAVVAPAAPMPQPSRTVVGMPAVVPSAVAQPAEPHYQRAPESVKGGRRDTKKSRKGVAVASDNAAHEETDKLLEALDAGFDTITRPSQTPFVSITPSTVPDVPAEPAAMPDRKPEENAEAKPAEAPPAIASATAKPAGEILDEAARRAQHESDMNQVRALFTEMAIAHARPLRDFMIEVSWGEPTREWLDIAVPAAAGLRRASEALEMADLGVALDGFSAALELAVGEASLDREVKDLLIGAYGKLVELLPAAFALEGERGRREPIIVRSLLLQVPGVHKIAIDKIYAAGLVSLEMLYAAGPRDLAETTGLDIEIAGRIHERFQGHRREIAGLDPSRDRAAERAELSTVVGDLAAAHEAHERAASSWAPDAAATRARARKDRNDLMLRVNVLLARMGEVDRLKALERATFGQKVEALRSFLDEAKRKGPRP